MAKQGHFRFLLGILSFLIFCLLGFSFTRTAAAAEAQAQTQQALKIIINIPAHSLALYKGNEKIRLYPVGLGKPATPTPVGYFSVLSKEENPTWIDPGDSGNQISSGPSNPLGYRWMQVWGNYGIHGTNKPNSIGGYVSNGCIRMREPDVEALYNLVSVGTPVEIMYNRVVIEKTKDDTVAYYIYPDAYHWQNLDVSLVKNWLKGFGVQDFVADSSIEKKIQASDGNPTYIAKVYPLYINGKKTTEKAVVKDDVTYLPAQETAKAVGLNVTWDASANTLATNYGKATAYNESGVAYCNSDDVGTLFHLEGGLQKDGSYALTQMKTNTTTTTTATTTTAKATTAQPEKKAEAAATPAKAEVKPAVKTQAPQSPGTAAQAPTRDRG